MSNLSARVVPSHTLDSTFHKNEVGIKGSWFLPNMPPKNRMTSSSPTEELRELFCVSVSEQCRMIAQLEQSKIARCSQNGAFL